MTMQVNKELIIDFLHTFPERRDATLLHFGDSWYQDNRADYEQRDKEVVYKLAQHQYICQPGKRSGDTGLVELVTVVEQTGFTEADLKPVPPERLIAKLKELVPYPVTQEKVRLLDHEQVVVCVEI